MLRIQSSAEGSNTSAGSETVQELPQIQGRKPQGSELKPVSKRKEQGRGMTPGQLSGSAGYSEDTHGAEGFGPHPSQELGSSLENPNNAIELSQKEVVWLRPRSV